MSAASTPPVVVETIRRTRKPARHFLELYPPPPMVVLTVDQTEAQHPGIKGRLRQWIKHADAGDPEYRWLSLCVLRVAGSVFIDDVKFRDQLHQRTALPPRARKHIKSKAASAEAA